MTTRNMKIDAEMHADLTGGAPLVCRHCGGEQTIEQTAFDPLMYLADEAEDEAECDRCRDLRGGWAQECDITRWEEAQR